MIETKRWILGLTLVVLLLTGFSYITLTMQRESSVVEIVQNGIVLQEIDLSEVVEEYSFSIAWKEGGFNRIQVRKGSICVEDADCPDQRCVMQGWLSHQAAPIVCIPHRLMIRVKESGNEIDAIAR